MKKEEITALFGKFESISCEVEGIECWSARELQPLLGYAKWDNFINNVVVKAKEACRNAGEDVQNHFPDVGKMVSIGYGVDTVSLYTSPSPRDLSTSRMPSSA